MVRGAADEELHGLNQFQDNFQALDLDAGNFEFGSEIRQRADDAGVFEQTILREG